MKRVGRKQVQKLPYWSLPNDHLLKQQLKEFVERTTPELEQVFLEWGMDFKHLGFFMFPGSRAKHPYYKYIYSFLFAYYIGEMTEEIIIKKLTYLIAQIVVAMVRRPKEKMTKELEEMIKVIQFFGGTSGKRIRNKDDLNLLVNNLIFAVNQAKIFF